MNAVFPPTISDEQALALAQDLYEWKFIPPRSFIVKTGHERYAALFAVPGGGVEHEPSNPLHMKLPCDIKVGHVTIHKGVPLQSLVNRMQVLQDCIDQLTANAKPQAEPPKQRHELVNPAPQATSQEEFDAYKARKLASAQAETAEPSDQELIDFAVNELKPSAWLITGGRVFADRVVINEYGANRDAIKRSDGSKVLPQFLASDSAPAVLAEREACSKALRRALIAMDVARDAIQPITTAQMKLHRLNPQTDSLLDGAAGEVIAVLERLDRAEAKEEAG